jgi:signal peptidase I
MDSDLSNTRKRKIWLAVLLHIVQPGFGHYYNGRLRRGIIIFFVYEILSCILGLIAIYYESILLFDLSLLISFCIWIYFLIDVIIINRKNNKIGYQSKRYNNRWYMYLIVSMGILIYFEITDNYDTSHIYDIGKTGKHSMENTILEGDIIFVKKFSLDKIGNGDIVEINSPIKPLTKYIKRCIAVGGQTVEIKNRDVYVDGQLIPLPSTGKSMDSTINYGDSARDSLLTLINNIPSMVIPKNCIFVMGDNRDNSLDSRRFGPVFRTEITGKALFVLFSTGEKPDYDASIITRAIAAFSNIRWKRIGLKLQ